MKRGFTLVEILVVIGVFGILMVAGTDFLIQVVRNSNQAAAQNEVRQTAEKIMQELSASVRNSVCVTTTTPQSVAACGSAPYPCSDVFLTTYLDSCNTAIADQYWFSFQPNAMTNSGKVFKKNSQTGGNWTEIASSSAVVNCPAASQCGTSWQQCSNGVSFSQPTGKGISVNFLVVQATTSAARSDLCAVASLSGTITPRGQY